VITRAEYAERLAAHEPREVSYGFGGIELIDAADLEAAQEGYTGEGWNDSWLVIGRDTLEGDPLFTDLDDPQLPVYTAMHGEGEWDPDPVATTLDAFFAALTALAAIAEGREFPVALDENPLSEDERTQFLQAVGAANPGIDLSYWEQTIAADDG
jgi:hypothetical protein